jgi:hypothetical protein
VVPTVIEVIPAASGPSVPTTNGLLPLSTRAVPSCGPALNRGSCQLYEASAKNVAHGARSKLKRP